MMQLKIGKSDDEKTKKKNWHSWFAWHPVLVVISDTGAHLVWLQYVERRYNGWDWDYNFWDCRLKDNENDIDSE